jgi:hypothetical protein
LWILQRQYSIIFSYCVFCQPLSALRKIKALPRTRKAKLDIARIMGGAPVTPPSSLSLAAPPPQPRTISSGITLQAPLSRRGRGPGLVLVLDHYAATDGKEGCLDPPPMQKWAEEGFAVVQVCQCMMNGRDDRSILCGS